MRKHSILYSLLFCISSVASESALEILTDILDDFNTKLCHLLRTAVDNEALNGRSGFSVSDPGYDMFAAMRRSNLVD